ncbi:uncharacterized protein N7459_002487 [Penicillium hispanicum]|uniref:uncharacterized protein n=1 Tax=Penicillium hispanicum TaxID=1080232 RepID=UPI0025414C07|nr:uncharacterized protein N7459_002487 [Penicillium hispanicum]KAJ5586722.1 hypothetical protein N7459_002487 [Penicillium hispanicum]
MDPHREARTASLYTIPPRHLVSVEHPAVIRNLDKAVETLQGEMGIKKILNPPKADAPASLMMRPEDIMARPIQSTSTAANNVLLKVTVPKRTGRKRKRGSDEPFKDATPEDSSGSPQRRSSKELLRSLRDNASTYRIDPVGRVGRTHVFRGMPDFVYSTTNSHFAQKFREYIFPYDLEKLKHFDIDLGKGATTNADTIPPPSLSNERVPFLYMHRQNPGVKQTLGESGQMTTVNIQQPVKVRTHLISYDIPVVPSKPQESLPPIETLDSALRGTIDAVNALFEQRPAWTRRALRNLLTSAEQRYLLRHAIPYIGYIFRSGPWRDAIIKLGHDPRTSPEYRHYQTFMFRILPRETDVIRDGGGGRRHNFPRHDEYRREEADGLTSSETAISESHLFKCQLPLVRDGRIWQVCDIKDPVLANILYPPNPPDGFLRPTCEIVSDGWFGNGTLAKAKTIMRFKIQSLIENRIPEDTGFERVLDLPDHAYSEADIVHFQVDSEVATSREVAMATEVRSAIKGAASWRPKSEKERQDEERHARRMAKSKRQKGAILDEPEEENVAQEQSEGEEEEMERAEMLEDQVAAALAARDAAELEAEEDEVNDGDDNENDNAGEEDDEIE